MKSKPLSPPPAICCSNIRARGGSLFRLLEGTEEKYSKCRLYYESEYHGQPAFTATAWRWNEPSVTENKQEAE